MSHKTINNIMIRNFNAFIFILLYAIMTDGPYSESNTTDTINDDGWSFQ